MENTFIFRDLRSEFDRYADENGCISDIKAQKACWKFGVYPSTSQIFEVHVCHNDTYSKCFHGLQFYEFCLLIATLKNSIYQNENKKSKLHKSASTSPFVKWPNITLRKSKKPRWDVFLGGACNPTTWRFDVAIPFLKEKNITFYNPQVSEWDSSLIQIEEIAKQSARVLFFVLDIRRTRGIASLVEAAYLSGQGRNLVLVLPAEVPEKKEDIDVKELDDNEFQSIHRSYLFIADLVQRQGIPIFTSTSEALKATRASLISNRMVQDLTEIDGVKPVKHSFVNVSITIRTLQSIFNCLDTSHDGAITIRDAKQGLCTILGKYLSLSSTLSAMSNQNCSNIELLSHNYSSDKMFTFPEFCIIYSVILMMELHNIRLKKLQSESVIHYSASVEDMKIIADCESCNTPSLSSLERNEERINHDESLNTHPQTTTAKTNIRGGLRSANSTLMSYRQTRPSLANTQYQEKVTDDSQDKPTRKESRRKKLPSLHIPSPIHQIVDSEHSVYDFTIDTTKTMNNKKTKKKKKKCHLWCVRFLKCCCIANSTAVAPNTEIVPNEAIASTTKLDAETNTEKCHKDSGHVGKDNQSFLNDHSDVKPMGCPRISKQMHDDNGDCHKQDILDDDDDEEVKKYDVFLGGTCGDSDWRENIAKPLLRKNGCTYYDPQIAHSSWTRRLLPMEAEARARSKVLVYVITNESTSTAALVEAAHFIGQGKRVVMHVQFLVQGGYTSPPMTPMAQFLQSSCSFPISSRPGGTLEIAAEQIYNSSSKDTNGNSSISTNNHSSSISTRSNGTNNNMNGDLNSNMESSSSSGYFSANTPGLNNGSCSNGQRSSVEDIIEDEPFSKPLKKTTQRSQSTQRNKIDIIELDSSFRMHRNQSNNKSAYFSDLKPISNKLSTSDTGKLIQLNSPTATNKKVNLVELGYSMNNISKINPLPAEACKDHNRGRKYLMDIANLSKIPVFPTIDETINHAILLAQTPIDVSPFQLINWRRKRAM